MRYAAALWRRFAEIVRLVGAGRALALTPVWLLRRDFIVFSRDLAAPLPDVPRPNGLKFGMLAPDDLDLLREVDPAMDRLEVRRRLAEGQSCIVGRLDQRPVYYNWGTSRSIYLTYAGLRLALQPGDVFGDNSYVNPAVRSMGIGAAGQAEYYRRARAQGARRHLGLVAAWNRASQRVGGKLDRRPIARVECWQLGPWRHIAVHGAARLDGGTLTILVQAAPPRAAS
jgi:hypothetical protein